VGQVLQLAIPKKDAASLKERGVGFIVSSLARINGFVLRNYFAQQSPVSQHAPDAQQAASQTQGPPASHAQPSSAQAQFAHTQAAPQQQSAPAFAEPKLVVPTRAAMAKEANAAKPKMTDFIFKLQNMFTNGPSATYLRPYERNTGAQHRGARCRSFSYARCNKRFARQVREPADRREACCSQ
jgi:hypothetical protein